MSLAYAQFKPEQIAGLALFATPWNFHAEDVVRFTLTDAHVQNIEALITKHAFLPKEWMQMVFYLLYTQHIHRKFQSLAQLNPESAEAKELLVVEYWANDGMKIVSGVAKNCLIDWAYHNTPMTGKWQMNGEIVVPERIGCPTMVVIGKHDRIASYHSALPLAQKIQGSRLEVMETGHVGMVAGRYAEKTLWEPFAEWVLRL